MAKVLFGGGIADMRRSIEGNTFSRNKGGSYARQRVRPTNPQTPDQIALRDAMSLLSKRWGTVLTDAQRDAWTDFAELNPIIDVLGQPIVLSGIQKYNQLNTRLELTNNNILDDPPVTQEVEQLTTISLTAVVTPPLALTVTFSPDVPVDQGLQVFATPPLSPGITFVKNRLRLIEKYLDNEVSPSDTGPAWNTKFGVDPPVGSKIVVTARVLNSLNGAISVPLRASAIVT